jgi:signal transduction histidine kinase
VISMQKLRSVSLSARMLVASAVLALLVAGVFAILIQAVAALNDATRREAHAKDVTAATLRLEKLVLDVETGVNGYVASGARPAFLERWDDARMQVERQLPVFTELAASNPAQQRSARALASQIRAYIQDYAIHIVRIASANLPVARNQVARQEGKRRTDDIRARFKGFLEAENELAAASAASADRQADRAIFLAVLGGIASALLIALFGLYLARSTARPVRAAAGAATELARGDLAVRLDEKGPGEVGELTSAFNRMAEQLQRSRAELEEQNQKLRESERLKSELVSIVSHELRTPLASVLGFTSVLLTRDVEPDEQRRYLEIIDAQGRRLSSLLNDFLDIQRLEEGQLKLARELFDMGALVGEQVQLFSGQSDKHQLDIVLPPEPLKVEGDPNRLAQVVGNLLSNAIKYSPDGGTVEVVGERYDDRVRVSVRDEGLGIPRELHPQVFGKFFRGDAAASGIAGSGLGLTIARSVIEAHGGEINFKSARGQGSVFWLELPVAAMIDD